MEIKRNDGNCVQETLLQIYNIDVLTNNAVTQVRSSA
jgi:hypothetical protein